MSDWMHQKQRVPFCTDCNAETTLISVTMGDKRCRACGSGRWMWVVEEQKEHTHDMATD